MKTIFKLEKNVEIYHDKIHLELEDLITEIAKKKK